MSNASKSVTRGPNGFIPEPEDVFIVRERRTPEQAQYPGTIFKCLKVDPLFILAASVVCDQPNAAAITRMFRHDLFTFHSVAPSVVKILQEQIKAQTRTRQSY